MIDKVGAMQSEQLMSYACWMCRGEAMPNNIQRNASVSPYIAKIRAAGKCPRRRYTRSTVNAPPLLVSRRKCAATSAGQSISANCTHSGGTAASVVTRWRAMAFTTSRGVR